MGEKINFIIIIIHRSVCIIMLKNIIGVSLSNSAQHAMSTVCRMELNTHEVQLHCIAGVIDRYVYMYNRWQEAKSVCYFFGAVIQITNQVICKY